MTIFIRYDAIGLRSVLQICLLTRCPLRSVDAVGVRSPGLGIPPDVVPVTCSRFASVAGAWIMCRYLPLRIARGFVHGGIFKLSFNHHTDLVTAGGG